MKWYPFYISLITHFFSMGQNMLPSSEVLTDTTEINQLIELSKGMQWTDPDGSLSYAEQALVKSMQLGFKKGIAAAHNLRGFCFWTFGDNDITIEAALESIAIAEKENLQLIEGESYYILARAYMDLGEGKRARASIRKAESLVQGKDWELLSSIYNLMGVILFIDNKTDSALYFYKKALEVGKEHSIDPANFPRIISNIGECYAEENPALAFGYYNEALTLARETGNTISEASITDIMGHAYLRRNDLRDAEAHFQTSLRYARSLGLRRVIRHSYAGLVSIKIQQGKSDEAITYLRSYYAVNDSLLNSSKIRQMVELETKHDLELKEQNIQLLEREKEIQVIWKNLLIGLIILIILLSIGLYLLQQYRYRKNREMLNLEIDFLTQTVNKNKALVAPVVEGSIESYDQRLLRRAIAIVESNISDAQLTVERLAAEMNMSRASLHRKIKAISGFPPSELIRSIRLRKAAKLIVNKVDTVSQIALLVGFDDYSHFSKSFKKHFGVAPTNYEAQHCVQGQQAAHS